MSRSGKDFAVENFKKICRNEFGYLLNDFGFREVTLPLGEFENEFKIRFVRQDLTVIVEGIHYGTGSDANRAVSENVMSTNTMNHE